MTDTPPATRRQPVPRGLAADGPAILSYGFRPFFLGAGGFAVLAMTLWIGALTLGWDIGGSYGALNWHAHEMLFGYGTAALAGFMLTAIPNWTGRLPVAGRPLLGLVLVWVAGRLVMLAPDAIGLPAALVIESAFLPLLALAAGREIVSGRNWKNLKILAGLTGLLLANAGFHVSVVVCGSAPDASRVAVAIYVLLVALVGGRIVPSFTRNWLARAGAAKLPQPFGRFDIAALVVLLVASLAWAIAPLGLATAVLALAAAAIHAIRLWRWRGWATLEEPLLFGLHTAYACIPLGLAAVAAAALGALSPASALHVLTVGVIGNMTLAVMTRASRGHTGRPLAASKRTALSYLALLLATVSRPFAEILPDHYHLLLGASAACWLIGFGLFLAEYGPMLVARTAKARAA